MTNFRRTSRSAMRFGMQVTFALPKSSNACKLLEFMLSHVEVAILYAAASSVPYAGTATEATYVVCFPRCCASSAKMSMYS